MRNSIIFIATAWGVKHGGINSFNYDLVISLASIISSSLMKIICIVPIASEAEYKEAEDKGVLLKCLNSKFSNTTDLTEEIVPEIVKKISGYKPTWWIGHDLKTGPVALKAKQVSGGKCAIIHHMDYESYLPYYDDYPSDLISSQRQNLSKADIVFAVGPKLARSATDKLRSEINKKVIELIPGLAPIEGLQEQNRFSAIIFGRLDPKQDRLKQAKLAVVGFGRACRLYPKIIGKDASITIIGLNEDRQNEDRLLLKQILDKEAGRAVPLHGWQYFENRSALLDCLRQHSVCLMLSLHEGFGLVGWEAIAAEVPLIISTNTGVYDAISKYLGGVGRGCIKPISILGATGESSYRDEDVDIVANALCDVKQQGSNAKNDSRVLKNLLEIFCTWKHTAIDFAKACEIDISIDIAHKSLANLTPELLIEAFKKGSDVVEEASRRKDYFSHIWRRLSPPSDVKKHLILFGGVSQLLCTNDSTKRFCKWLSENISAELFFCYEVDEAASARAKRLNEDTLETDSGLSDRAFERMFQKQKIVESIPEIIIKEFPDNADILIKRFHLVKIRKPLSTYVIIVDNEIYLTPLFEKRASESLSFALSTKPSMNREVIRSVVYHLENKENETIHTKMLTKKLRNEFLVENNETAIVGLSIDEAK